MLNNKKLNLIVIKLFIRGRKLNISLIFITQTYLALAKTVRLNSTLCFIMKIPSYESFNKSHVIIHQILTLKTLHL